MDKSHSHTSSLLDLVSFTDLYFIDFYGHVRCADIHQCVCVKGAHIEHCLQ